MRLWTIHPRYLDQKGLVAVWREALLAQKVLLNDTKGYRNHPQLVRFKNTKHPLGAIGNYLEEIYKESLKRGYRFDGSKIVTNRTNHKINVKRGQIQYELKHLKNKLNKRDMKAYQNIRAIKEPEANPVFNIVNGGIETWEIVY